MKGLTRALVFGTAALLSTSAIAFGEKGQWSSGWGQGTTEYAAVNQRGDRLYIACNPYEPVKMTLTAGGRDYGSYGDGDFSLVLDGNEIQTPYETNSRVGENNFFYAWEHLRKSHSIVAVTSDGQQVALPSQGSFNVLPEAFTPEYPCRTSLQI
ncbi:hypothetical protein RSO68_13880 [Halomonas saccharevitans]|uniref:Uncharacterized protein n=1 Tax=Halomonas saccharevitans TaxID=416872 RepID=A0ABU3NHB9_9GAMM|nr:hypothetical protein [Halomonas saccharevitans]MDT8880563.1 hypothetical protein [Halomonas saccharevitans]